MILCMYVKQSDHFRLTIQQSSYDKDLAGWPMSNFVKSVYFNLIFRLCNKIENYNLRHIASSICFFIQQRAKASVSYSIAQQLFLVAGWRQAIP